MSNLTLLLGLLCLLLTAALLYVSYRYFREKARAPRNFSDQSQVSYETPDFSEQAGFRFTRLPSSEILIPLRYWLCGGTTAEIEYVVVPNHMLTFKVGPCGQCSLPQRYQTAAFEEADSYDYDGITIHYSNSPGRQTVIQWERDGFDFLLYADDTEMNQMGGLVDVFLRYTQVERT